MNDLDSNFYIVIFTIISSVISLISLFIALTIFIKSKPHISLSCYQATTDHIFYNSEKFIDKNRIINENAYVVNAFVLNCSKDNYGYFNLNIIDNDGNVYDYLQKENVGNEYLYTCVDYDKHTRDILTLPKRIGIINKNTAKEWSFIFTPIKSGTYTIFFDIPTHYLFRKKKIKRIYADVNIVINDK